MRHWVLLYYAKIKPLRLLKLPLVFYRNSRHRYSICVTQTYRISVLTSMTLINFNRLSFYRLNFNAESLERDQVFIASF